MIKISNPFGPPSPFGAGGPPIRGNPLGPGSAEDELLRRYGEDEASIWRSDYPHDDHTDAELFKKAPDGRYYRIGKDHVK